MNFEEWKAKTNTDGYKNLEELLYDAWWAGHNFGWDHAYESGRQDGMSYGVSELKRKIYDL